MEVRRIKPEERVQSSLLSTIVFLGEASFDYRERLENPLEHSEGYENIWGAFDGGGKMCSNIYVHPFQIRYDGHTVGMGGIGGVATLPESRRGGYVRGLFEKILPDMYERGDVFSFLYPFSFAFYRKFGYELCYTLNRVRIPVTFFRQYPYPDGVTLRLPCEDYSDFNEIYGVFSRDFNLACVRNGYNGDWRWSDLLNKDPYKTRNYAYLHRNAEGKPDAYLLCNADTSDDDGNILNVREFAWADTAGLYAMFGFIGGLSAQFSSLRWDMPDGINIFPLFNESYEVERRVSASGMNRVVNVRRALELIRAPQLNGRAVVYVNDKFMPVNTGSYAVEWEDGRVSVSLTDKTADLETDVETLAQLVTGFISFGEARFKREVAVNGADGALAALFPRKNLYIMERF